MKREGLLCQAIVSVISVILLTSNAIAYSVLTHEALIDFSWNESIRPLLLAKFPNATDHHLLDIVANAKLRKPGQMFAVAPLRSTRLRLQ